MYGYIYKTTNTVNNKIYVGKHKGKFDENYHGSGIALHNAMKKYDETVFKTELIEECTNLENLNTKEKYWIETLDARNPAIGYNIAPGGDGGVIWKEGEHPSSGVRRFGEDNPFYGKHHSEETKLKVKQVWKQKIADGYVSPAKGKPNKYKGTIFVTNGDERVRIKKDELDKYITNGWVYRWAPKDLTDDKPRGGWHQSEHQKAVASKVHKGKKVSDKSIEKFRDTMANKSDIDKMMMRKNMSDSHKGKLWVTDGTNSAQINPEDYQEFEYFGFYLGRVIKNS